MNKVIDPKPILDTTIDQITESDDGSLEISFVPNQRTRLTLPRSNSVRQFSDTFSDLAARSSLSEKPYRVSYPSSTPASFLLIGLSSGFQINNKSLFRILFRFLLRPTFLRDGLNLIDRLFSLNILL